MELRYLLAAGIVSTALPGATVLAQEAVPLTVAAAVSAAIAEDEELDAVTVTARRRDEELQDVPLPVSVVDGTFLEEQGSFNVARLQQLQPALQFYSQNPRNSFVNIRGFGAPFGLTNDGIEQGVGLYVDDVYYSRAAASTLDFLDVERLEVLRGPQGTLYGKNTTAGAINITTRAPTFVPVGSTELSVGNLGFYQAKAAISGPLAGESVAGRLALSTTSRHGTIYNVATTNRVNELDNVGFRGQILWRATDTLKVTFSGDYNKQNGECCAQIAARHGVTQRGANRQYFALAEAFDYVAPGTDLVNRTFSPFDRVTDVDGELSARNELGGAAVRAVWGLGQGTFTAVSAWRYWDWVPANDRDFTGLPITTKSNNPSTQEQVTQEFRYSFTGERFDYVVGLFGYHQNIHTDGITQRGPAASRWNLHPVNQAVLANAPEVLDGSTSLNDIDYKNTSAALFGQLSWRLTDRFRVEPGLRLNYDRKRGTYVATVSNGAAWGNEVLPTDPTDPFYSDPTPVTTSAGGATTLGAVRAAQRSDQPPQAYGATFSDWNVSGNLTVAYDLSRDVLAYATWGKGFKTGGITNNGAPTDANGNPILAGTTVRPEKVTQYEAGLKTQFLDRSATLNLAAFRTEVKDYQATVFNNTLGGSVRGYLANAEGVEVQGLEADFSYRPNYNWNFYVNAALTDHEYSKFTGAPCPPELSGNSTVLPPGQPPQPATPGAPSPSSCDISGQWVPGLSKLAGSWGFQYQRPANFLGREGELYFGYDGSARSRFSSNPSRSIYTDIGGYGLANFRLGFRTRGNWDVYGWVKNAFDKDYFEALNASTGGNTGLIAGQPADPRTWGLTIRTEF
ncbi:MAG TPA: TonB-dependent receptor [Steroidobacteraceae bacterium]|nr:TonB-dependent receptor [Steroidobacteraceae bacterium]